MMISIKVNEWMTNNEIHVGRNSTNCYFTQTSQTPWSNKIALFIGTMLFWRSFGIWIGWGGTESNHNQKCDHSVFVAEINTISSVSLPWCKNLSIIWRDFVVNKSQNLFAYEVLGNDKGLPSKLSATFSHMNLCLYILI